MTHVRPPAAIQLTQLSTPSGPALHLDDGGTATLAPAEYGGRLYVFKRYRDEYRAAASARQLERILRWQQGCSPADQRMLTAVAAWPQSTVWDGDDLLGLLVPPAPSAFLTAGCPRSLDMLMQLGDGGPSQRRDALSMRLNAFGHLIATVTWFHDRRVVINDLYAHNVLVSRFGDAVYLVDCDSMVSPYWDPVLPKNFAPDSVREVIPEADVPTVATDFARLAHVIICTLFDEEVVDLGADYIAELNELLTEPVATFVRAARTVSNHTEDAAVQWRVLGERWSETPSWGTAPAADVSEPGEPVGGRLLPDGFHFTPFDTSLLAQGLDLSGPYGRRSAATRGPRLRPTVVRTATWQPSRGRLRLLAIVIAAAVLLTIGVLTGTGMP